MPPSWVIQLMAVCQKCGKENASDSAVCSDCGTPLPAKRKANLAGTMLGMPSPLSPDQGSPAAPSPAPAPERDKPNKKAFAGTMIGMPSPIAPATTQPATTASSPTPSDAERPKANPLGQTMVGMGPSVGREVAATQAAPGKRDAAEPAPTATPTPTTPNKKFQGTLLGIAQPGIAPSLDPKAKAPPGARPTPVDPTPEPAPAPAPSFSSEPVHRPFPTTRPVWKTALMIGGGMAIAAAIGGGVALLAPKPVTVVVEKFSIDDDGNDQLELRCDDCPSGSKLILGEAEATVEDKRAILTPRSPLSLGRNELQFTLMVQDEIRDAKKVILPIAFRVLTNWKGLHESPPFGQITVAAPAGSALKIDGKDLRLKDETAEYLVDFEKETTGESPKVQQVTSKHDIVVTVNESARTTSAILQNGITPLTLSSPSSVHHLGGKPVSISGRTSAGATVTIGDKKLVADDKGAFIHILETPEPGEVVVSAYSEKFLTRQVTVTLTKEAPSPKDATTKFSELTPGVTADLRANVIESRTAGGTTQALLEVENGCEAPPCLLRAVYGEPKKLTPNRAVRLTGYVAPGTPLTVKVTRFR